jgi:hypothetical protein
MIDINKIMLDLGILTESEPFTQAQKHELHELINKVEIPGPGIINPLNAIKLIKGAEATMNAYEKKYLDFGGSPGKLKELEESILKDVKETLPGISTPGQVKRILNGGKQ